MYHRFLLEKKEEEKNTEHREKDFKPSTYVAESALLPLAIDVMEKAFESKGNMKLDGVGPLITDHPPISSTNL